MQPSSSFDRALFVNSNPATDEYFEERASKLFEPENKPETKKPCIGFHVSPPRPDNSPERPSEDASSPTKIVPESTSDSESDCPSISVLPVDHIRHSSGNPPQYVDAPGLNFRDVSDKDTLIEIAAVKTLSLCETFIIQLISSRWRHRRINFAYGL